MPVVRYHWHINCQLYCCSFILNKTRKLPMRSYTLIPPHHSISVVADQPNSSKHLSSLHLSTLMFSLTIKLAHIFVRLASSSGTNPIHPFVFVIIHSFLSFNPTIAVHRVIINMSPTKHYSLKINTCLSKHNRCGFKRIYNRNTNNVIYLSKIILVVVVK